MLGKIFLRINFVQDEYVLILFQKYLLTPIIHFPLNMAQIIINHYVQYFKLAPTEGAFIYDHCPETRI